MESEPVTQGECREVEDIEVWGPREGMEFESDEAAKEFYKNYAPRVGFMVRVMKCRRSERDGRIVSRQIGCNKEGHKRRKPDAVSKPRKDLREGCKAMICYGRDRFGNGKWIVRKVFSEHNHPLVASDSINEQSSQQIISPRLLELFYLDEKESKIRELTKELAQKNRLNQLYRDQLIALINEVEKHGDVLAEKAEIAFNNLKEFESKK